MLDALESGRRGDISAALAELDESQVSTFLNLLVTEDEKQKKGQDAVVQNLTCPR